MRDFLAKKFQSICSRPTAKGLLERLGQGISDEFIASIVENGLVDVNYPEDRLSIVVVCVEEKEPYNIVSFISAEIGVNDDVHGELICTSADSVPGLGKLQISAILLSAKEAGVNFVFIQAISGLFGVQASLYSRFGFEFRFPPELLRRKTAMEQYLIGETFGKSETKLGIWEKEYAHKRTLINWITSLPMRLKSSLLLVPMWIYIPSISSECIENILTKKGWDCRVGEVGGPGGYSTTGDTRTWKGFMQRLMGLEPSRETELSQYFGKGLEDGDYIEEELN